MCFKVFIYNFHDFSVLMYFSRLYVFASEMISLRLNDNCNKTLIVGPLVPNECIIC